MGNQQTRKRPHEEDDHPPAKRPRFDHTVAPTGHTLERKHKDAHAKRQRFSLCHPAKLLKSAEESTVLANRCRSWDDGDEYARLQSTASCSTYRPEYPIPRLEAWFLPEFPTRSSVTEDSFIISNEIGSGSFGRVYRAITVNDVCGVYAIKIQEKAKVLTRNAVVQVKREASLLRLLPHHVFISRLYATWQSRTKLFSVLQYPVGGLGDLFTIWREMGNLDEPSLRIYAAEIACALDFIHRHNIIYRDLKLENIILDSEAHVQLIDFGFAKQLRNGQKTSTICGTLQYMSPTVVKGEPYSHEVDWWSYGVLLHILFTGRYPYPNAEAKHHTQLKFIDYHTPFGCSKHFGNFLDRLLTTRSEDRLCSFAFIHAHSFFQGMNFEDVEAKKYKPLNHLRTSKIPLIDADDRSVIDGEENWQAFEENYEFDDGAYFNDKV